MMECGFRYKAVEALNKEMKYNEATSGGFPPLKFHLRIIKYCGMSYHHFDSIVLAGNETTRENNSVR